MGGSAKKPDDPPPAPAPVRADSSAGEQGYKSAGRRRGLRSTILDQESEADTLAAPTLLGGMGTLGAGGEGVMLNTVKPRQSIPGFPGIFRDAVQAAQNAKKKGE